MDNHFYRSINAVRFRQRVQRTLNCAAWGLLAAALVVLFSPTLAATVFTVSIAIGFIRSFSDSSAARLIDRHYHLKDRILTTTALLRRTNHTLMEQLQIDDTANHITTVKPQMVHPIRLPKMFWCAVGVFALHFIGTTIIQNWSHGSVESAILVELSEETTTMLEEMVAQTEELAMLHADEESLPKLFDKLDTLTQRFESKMTAKETLMTLSEMENAFQAALDSLKLETMDDLLKELAKTLELADPTFPISKALEKEDFRLAALELKELDADTLAALTDAERNAMAEQMQAIADSAEEQNQLAMHEAAQAMSAALKDGDDEAGAAAADALAHEVETHGIRMDIGNALAKQLMELGLAKSDFGIAMDGGEGTAKSDTDKETWGMGSAGNPNDGEETQLDSERHQEILTGMISEEGASQTETLDTQEMDEVNSLRQFREQFQEYQKLSEAVLDSEPIPLGQRRVIRHYFESIRPSAE